MPPPQRKATVHLGLFSFIFVVVCCACLLLAALAGLQGYRGLRQELQADNAASGQSTSTLQSGKEEFDRLKDRADNTQKLITTLIALSSLYAVVLTVTGYLNVQKILGEAQAALDDAVATKDALSKEYGSLTQISQNLQGITRELRESLPDVQELSSYFKKIGPEDREKFYFQEKVIAFAQLVTDGKDPNIAESLSGAFVALARFYRGLYIAQKRLDQDKLNRALFYANQAKQQSPTNFVALNELGNCLFERDSISTDEPLKQFQESLKRNRDQQKARFYISVIYHKRDDFKAAADLLTEAIALDLWETTKEQARRYDLHYNRACAYARLAENYALGSAARDSLLLKARQDVELADVPRTEVSLDTFMNDIKPGGDLALLNP